MALLENMLSPNMITRAPARAGSRKRVATRGRRNMACFVWLWVLLVVGVARPVCWLRVGGESGVIRAVVVVAMQRRKMHWLVC